MNDDFFDDGDFDDFSDDFDDDGDSFEDDSNDGFETDDGLNEETQDESEHEDDGIDIGWEEIAMFGSLAEEIAEERERRKLEKKMDDERGKRNND